MSIAEQFYDRWFDRRKLQCMSRYIGRQTHIWIYRQIDLCRQIDTIWIDRQTDLDRQIQSGQTDRQIQIDRQIDLDRQIDSRPRFLLKTDRYVREQSRPRGKPTSRAIKPKICFFTIKTLFEYRQILVDKNYSCYKPLSRRLCR